MITLQVQVPYTPLGSSSSQGHSQFFVLHGNMLKELEADLERQKETILAGCWRTIRFEPGYHVVGIHNTRSDWEAVYGKSDAPRGAFSGEGDHDHAQGV